MTARAFFLSGALLILATLVSGTVSYHAGLYAGEARGINAAADRSELRQTQREARNQRLIDLMVYGGACPPVDAYCPAIRMTAR